MRKPSPKAAARKPVTKPVRAVRETASQPHGASDPTEAPQGEATPAAVPSPALPSAGPEPVLVGGVAGRLARVPVGLVQAIVGDELTNLAAGLRTPAVSDLMLRMRTTDARCAPVYLTYDGDPGTKPALFAGLDAFAAALQLGLDEMFVVTVPSSEAQRLQAALILAQQNSRPAPDDDALLYQVHNYHRS